ncbi:MAG: 4-alpha-glucanotransferase, partial [Pseudomonadota bacterium]|nr:4-alpha-glucanotransferase [Pseudomonadota bacterium]
MIDRLARLRGIGDAYHDFRGELRYFSRQTKVNLLRAMGCAVDDDAALAAECTATEIARSRCLLPALASGRAGVLGVDLNVRIEDAGGNLQWTVHLEDGGRRDGSAAVADCPEVWRGDVEGAGISRRRFELPMVLPPGYHRLEVQLAAANACCVVVISPPQCFEPAAIAQGRRLWGVAVQLYTVRSRRNWGIGDFGDLAQMIRWLAPQGAAFIGLNPLHALAPADPARASPYSASNRNFLNVLYISVADVAEFGECAAAQARVREPSFVARLTELRNAPLVAYEGVAELKREILTLVFEHFCARHLQPGSERGAQFRAFTASGGALLHDHACFDALDRHLRVTLGTS